MLVTLTDVSITLVLMLMVTSAQIVANDQSMLWMTDFFMPFSLVQSYFSDLRFKAIPSNLSWNLKLIYILRSCQCIHSPPRCCVLTINLLLILIREFTYKVHYMMFVLILLKAMDLMFQAVSTVSLTHFITPSSHF